MSIEHEQLLGGMLSLDIRHIEARALSPATSDEPRVLVFGVQLHNLDGADAFLDWTATGVHIQLSELARVVRGIHPPCELFTITYNDTDSTAQTYIEKLPLAH